MRLLPRSPRGTWLLAGAVWVAGCGALWLLWNAPDCLIVSEPVPPGVRVWDARTGAEITPPGGIWGRVYSRAGDYLRRFVQFCATGHWPPAQSVTVTFSPDGRRVIRGGFDTAAKPPPPAGFLAAAALLALPLAGLAWWRGRPPRSRRGHRC